MGKSQRSHPLRWKRTPSPTSLLKQAFEILPRCDDLRLAIDTPEPPQAETPHAMPVFGFGKEWFDPDFPLVHGPLVGVSLVISFHALLIVRKKRTVDVPTTLVGSTVGFQGAGITRASWSTVFHKLCLLFSVRRQQELSLRAAILIMGRVLGELSWSIIGCLVFPIG
jgi:hypothetical protein